MRVYQRGKSGIWWVDLTIDGERIKRSTGTTEKQAAEEYAATLARDLWRAKRLGDTPTVTWDHAVIEWLKEHPHRRSIEDIKLRLRWLTQHLQGKALASITDKVIRQLLDTRKAQLIDGEPTANSTVNRHAAELSKILHYAHRRGWLGAVPPIPKREESKGRVAWITREQAKRLLAELPDHLQAMARLALATGLRETNVRLLCWQQIDLERRIAWIYGDQAKAGKDLTIPLNDDAMAVLLEQKGRHKRWVFPVPRWERDRHGSAVQVADTPTGKISNHAWRKACTRAGLAWLKFHDLRHTWASWHVQAGTPLPVLQELGGWASYSMVLRYAHLSVPHVAGWASNISFGTNTVQAAQTDAKENGPHGAVSERDSMGWLMGLEPTTTGITKRSQRGEVLKINDLQSAKKRKTG